MKSVRKKRSNGGFSIIEVLISAFVVGLTATLLGATFPTGDRSRLMASNESTAISIAQRQIEVLRSIGYSSLTQDRLTGLGVIQVDGQTVDGFNFSNSNSGVNDSAFTSLPNGRAYLKMTQVEIDLKEVIVTISWQDNGRTRTVRVGTMVANL
jgi:type II secretory pathway pseudopilin PulG